MLVTNQIFYVSKMRCYMLTFLFSLIIYFVQAQSDCSNVVIITDFDPYSCDRSKNEYYTESVDDTCIPGCVTKIGECVLCDDANPCKPGFKCLDCGFDEGQCVKEDNPTPSCECKVCESHEECAPGLKCDEEKLFCVQDPNSATKCFYQKSTPSWTPNCLPDGSFAPKQCKGEPQNGRCYCFSKAGKRIYGEEWSYKSQNMTCACSLQRSELEKRENGKEGRTDVSLHCDSMGNYEPLQCDSGACWCSDPQTGEVVASVVPEEMMSILPCYNKTLVGDQYLRICESQLLAQNKIRSEFADHGTGNVMMPFIRCDYDGGYGPLKVLSSQVYCSWRDGKNIHTYASPQSEMAKKPVDCLCARDTKIYELAGKELTKMCAGNGNYDLLQTFDDKQSYCIDRDGFLTFGPAPGADLLVEHCLEFLP